MEHSRDMVLPAVPGAGNEACANADWTFVLVVTAVAAVALLIVQTIIKGN